jgi:DNA-binding winged helix-turn-helix (wHTH) protein
LEIDTDSYEIRRGGSAIRVEPRVFDFLIYLIENRDRMVSKDELLTHVWDGCAVGDPVIARCASITRRLLKDPSAIRTVHTRGYQWVGPVQANARSAPDQNQIGSPPISARSAHDEAQG